MVNIAGFRLYSASARNGAFHAASFRMDDIRPGTLSVAKAVQSDKGHRRRQASSANI